jgi:hypothetical protein
MIPITLIEKIIIEESMKNEKKNLIKKMPKKKRKIENLKKK